MSGAWVDAVDEATFWLANEPQIVVRGKLDLHGGLVSLTGAELVSCMTVVEWTPQMVSQTMREDTNTQYLIHGLTDDGVEITLLDANRGACRHGRDEITQEMQFLVALKGGHVSGDERYSEATASFPEPFSDWLFAHEAERAVIPNYGRITVGASSAGVEMDELPGLTLEQFERFALLPLQTLMMIVHGLSAPVLDLTVAAEGKRPLTVIRKGMAPTARTLDRALVPYSSIGAGGLTAWYEMHYQLNPLTSVVAKAIVGNSDLEQRVLNLAAALEAAHRGLYDQRSVPKEEVKRLRWLARDAVPSQYADRVFDALAQLGQMTYAERARSMTERIETISSKIAGEPRDAGNNQEEQSPRDIWVAAVKDARNVTAHMLPNTPSEFETYTGRQYVLYESLRWLLTAALLTHIGVSVKDVLEGLQSRSSFHLFQQRARHYWPDVYQSQEGCAGEDGAPAPPAVGA